MKIADIFGADIPFVGFCGIEPIESGGGRSRLEVDVMRHHGNQMGVAHGGLLMTLLDVCMGSAARSAVASRFRSRLCRGPTRRRCSRSQDSQDHPEPAGCR